METEKVASKWNYILGNGCTQAEMINCCRQDDEGSR